MFLQIFVRDYSHISYVLSIMYRNTCRARYVVAYNCSIWCRFAGKGLMFFYNMKYNP